MIRYVFICLVLCVACQPNSQEHVQQANFVEANYVGDESCQSCHNDIYETYHETGMGKSFSKFDPKTAPEVFNNALVYEEVSDYYYTAFVKDGKLYQKELKKDASGKVINETVYEAKFVVGSGNATRSYVMDVNGYLTEMPLTWYVQRKIWDMSPGYHGGNLRFERPINAECMTCHNDISQHETGTQNRFKKVALGIGCERCHGPGSAHVEKQLANETKGVADPTIVNPKRLGRAENLSVCQQCHVDGTAVFKKMESPETFRPGMLLSAHRTVFSTPEHLNNPEAFGIASHAVRLAKSACYQKSQMTCVTCHNPHEPQQKEGSTSYNQTCQSCHQQSQTVCSRPNEPKPMSGDCVSCHLAQAGTSDIPHVTFTDHWIRKELPQGARHSEPKDIKKQEDGTPVTLIPIPETLNAQQSEAENSLEEAVAYFKYYETRHPIKGYLPIVIEKAKFGLENGADLAEARLAYARTLSIQEKYTEAATEFDKATHQYPKNSLLWYWKAVNLGKQKSYDQALIAIEKSIALQPNLIEAYQQKSEMLSAKGDAERAAESLEKAIAKNPIHFPNLYNNLGTIYAMQNQTAKAIPIFEKALKLNPDLSQSMVTLGGIYALQSHFAQAKILLERAVKIQPNDISVNGNLGLLYMQEGNNAKARTYFEKVLELNPGDAQAEAYLNQLR